MKRFNRSERSLRMKLALKAKPSFLLTEKMKLKLSKANLETWDAGLYQETFLSKTEREFSKTLRTKNLEF